MESKFLSLFKNKKPIIGMIHLKGDTDEDVFERAKREIDIYIRCGMDGVMLENYYGNYYQLDRIMKYYSELEHKIPFGVNCLNNDSMCFELAMRYHADYLQLDSVIGHVKPRDEATMEAFMEMYRGRCDAAVLGGVRFKYQPVLSERTEAEDLVESKKRCDCVCVTEDATGQETSMDKIIRFREALGDFPLIVAAGVTIDNIEKQLKYCDAAIVGSYLKDNYQDNGDVSEEHVKAMVQKVTEIRGAYND